MDMVSQKNFSLQPSLVVSSV